MFVADSDFDVIPYNLPDMPDAPNALPDFIPFEEKKVLRSLLGSALYNEFVSALYVDPTAIPPVPIAENLIPQKWKDLRDGANYTLNNKVYRYDGLKNFLTPYIYSRWIEVNAHSFVNVAEIEGRVENSTVISPAQRISEAWDEFYRLVSNGDAFGITDSLYGFLLTNEETNYSTWIWTDPGDKNEFDL